MKRFLFGLLLLAIMAAPLAALAQGADDHRKALLWWYTTQRIWLDKPSSSSNRQPLPDSTDLTLDQVQKQLKIANDNNQDGGSYDLYNDVEGTLKSREMRLAEPLEIAQQIEGQLRKKRKGKPTYASVDILKNQFAVLMKAKPKDPVTDTPAPSPPALNLRVDSVEKQGDQKSRSATVISPQPATSTYSMMQMVTAGIFGALLGGIIVGWWLIQRTKAAVLTDEERIDRKYRTELLGIQERMNRLEGDNYRLNAALEPTRAKPFVTKERNAQKPTPALPTVETPPDAITPAALAGGETVEFAVEQPAPPPPPVRHYAPALETNFLEDRQLQPHSLTHLPVEIILDPANPQRARFGLNPGVEQRLVIDDGVNRLTEFFAFERPIQKPSSLRAGTPGELKREEGGWRVVRKAGLELS